MPEILRVDPASADAVAVLRRYYDDIITRYYGRPATEAEVEQQLAEDPDDDLRDDLGVFLLAYDDGRALGCAGARYPDAETAELTRVFVAPEGRGSGLAAALVGAVEAEARRAGRTRARLDTRGDLVEARALYAKLGYVEIAPFNDSPYAEHWFAKELTGEP
ncbi:GNAT family N-acetyltransferase [Agromyces sp. NPDC058104]|uniref:GNAT family N-acetyltransferase n=1 Tax=Agromyces sp. NPDC058104 TaxID=3346342 RepID=UPI0036DEE5C4